MILQIVYGRNWAEDNTGECTVIYSLAFAHYVRNTFSYGRSNTNHQAGAYILTTSLALTGFKVYSYKSGGTILTGYVDHIGIGY